MNLKPHPSRSLRVMVLLAVIALLFAACGGEDSGSPALDEFNGADEANAPSEREQVGGGDGGADGGSDTADADELGSGGIEPIVQPINFGRDIIYTADLTIAVTDVAAAGQEATRIMSGFDGLLFGQQTEGLPNPRSVLIFKVLPDDFQAALAALGSIGEVRTQNVSADDVTDRVVDLESRIKTAETSVTRLQGFLENATDIEAIAELEAQLVERETVLEQMRGQLRTLQDRIALATITLTLTEAFADPSVQLLTSGYVGEDAGAACPGDEGLTIDKGQEVNLCFEIRNDGDTVLTDLTLVDTVLDLSIADLTVIDGDPNADLQPGQSMILATTTEVDRRLRTQSTVTAVPVNDDGTAIETRAVSSAGSVVVRVEEPEGMPGFDDGLRVATDVLQWIGGVFVIGAGLAVPFLWLIPLAALLWWWRRRRVARGEYTSVIAADRADGEPEPDESNDDLDGVDDPAPA